MGSLRERERKYQNRWDVIAYVVVRFMGEELGLMTTGRCLRCGLETT